MQPFAGKERQNITPFVYEIIVWILYTGMFKYANYADSPIIINGSNSNFPHIQLLAYSITITLYIIPLYKWIAPYYLNAKNYGKLIAATVLYLLMLPKLSNWAVNTFFMQLNTDSTLNNFYIRQQSLFKAQAAHIAGWDLKILFTDFIAFASVTFMQYSFTNEQKKRLLERDNLILQMESLKAQLNPHFLFNTLNNIYGMSITGSKDVAPFILRLSDMMRYILYDCQISNVTLEKDIDFLINYFEMEKKRYPGAVIDFTVPQINIPYTIAPLLLIPFVENSFKHGAHRLNDKGFVKGHLRVNGNTLHFVLKNDVFYSTKETPQYGGVGIGNVKKRLELYYPGKHTLKIINNSQEYTVDLTIQLQ
jgi:hypothetical protein